ncbi:MAG: HAMP domain-containing sensor histidine kinase [Putridiphycobacter sp.]|nr:HAMP domain-containing sensor histidine kinase [Putridiphycobacter sp.]
MSVSLLGLLLLQFLWIKNVHQTRIEHFETSVEEAAAAVLADLDKIEKKVFYAGLKKNKNKSVFLSNNKLDYSTLIGDENTIKIGDTIINGDDKNTDYIVVSGSTVDSATGIIAESKVVTRSLDDLFEFPKNHDLFGSHDTTFSMPVKLGNSYEKNLLVKSKYLNELMVKMFSTNLFDDITVRLNLVLLDTLITAHLKANHIDTNFMFNVIDKAGKTVEFSGVSNNYSPDIKTAAFKYKLFPSDFVSSGYQLLIDFPNQKNFLAKQMWPTLLASLLLISIVVIAFYSAVSTIFKQKKVSEIKNDFISNMTHELKTPISTISLACEAIEDPDVSKNNDSLHSFINMISDENKRLGKLVEKVLQTSLLEKGSLKIQKEIQPIHDIVREAIKAFRIQFQRQGGSIEEGTIEDVYMPVDRVHFSNVIINLLDNALKYSPVEPTARVDLIKTTDGLCLKINDNGVGISKEDQKRIFDKLYRVSTGDIHNVKGFGLGLDYVKSIITLHGGQVSVKSDLGKGSTFKIELKNERKN